MTMKDATLKRIQELCPNIIDEHSLNCQMDNSHGYVLKHKDCISTEPITLAVVLRAIRESGFDMGDFLNGNGLFLVRDVEGRTLEWNLLKNYDDQTEETKRFIGSLLGV